MFIGIYGFGAIGRLLAKYAIQRGHEIIGVVDIDENIVGKDIGEILGLSENYGVEVSRDPLELADADIVFHATGSYLDKVYPQIKQLIDLSLDVISTCETLAYPYYRYPVLARKIDERARARSSTILGTGINPGFILDTLAIVLSSSLPDVTRIKAVRSLDAGKRRIPFRKKIGVGEEPEEVKKKLESGELTGHVGYAESICLIADALEINLSKIEEDQDIVIAEEKVTSGEVSVEKGQVSGIKGYGVGYVGDKEVIRLELHAYVGAEEYEEITIESSEYRVTWRSTGTPGDAGTISVLLNLAEKINMYGPGLLTMVDILPFKPYYREK